MRHRRDVVNRTVLIVLGLLLLAAGGYALLRSYGAFGSDQAEEMLLVDDVHDWVRRNDDWFWPVAGVVAALVAFAALRWLWAQRPIPMPNDDLVYQAEDGSTVVRSSVLSDAVEDELKHDQLVEEVRVGIEQDSDATVLVTQLAVRDGTHVAAVADDIVRPAVRHCSEATGRPASARVILEYSENHRMVR
ncbi:MAG TPA: hypothetical protein VK549_17735 [Acidimicrobiia bacterium]|nr:hypothetical protein [Acidimicrobiia bacterium]